MEKLASNKSKLQNQNDQVSDKYIVFNLGKESYGAEILSIKEIINVKDVTRLPNLPDFVKGVINLRGVIVPVVDLRLKLKLPPREYDKHTVIIVLESAGKTLGFVVDSVDTVDDLVKDSIQETPDIGIKIENKYIKGVGKKDERLIILLNLEKLFTQEENNQIVNTVAPTITPDNDDDKS